jgi:glutathione S-transferase
VSTPRYWNGKQLLDYVESSFAAVVMRLLLPKLKGKEPFLAAHNAAYLHFDYFAEQVSPAGLLIGEKAMLADVQFSFLLANLSNLIFLTEALRLAAYWAPLQQQSGYKGAIAKPSEKDPPI